MKNLFKFNKKLGDEHKKHSFNFNDTVIDLMFTYQEILEMKELALKDFNEIKPKKNEVLDKKDFSEFRKLTYLLKRGKEDRNNTLNAVLDASTRLKELKKLIKEGKATKCIQIEDLQLSKKFSELIIDAEIDIQNCRTLSCVLASHNQEYLTLIT